MSQRLYVGNLSPDVTEADLRLLFSRVGAVTEVQLNLGDAAYPGEQEPQVGFGDVRREVADIESWVHVDSSEGEFA